MMLSGEMVSYSIHHPVKSDLRYKGTEMRNTVYSVSAVGY